MEKFSIACHLPQYTAIAKGVVQYGRFQHAPTPEFWGALTEAQRKIAATTPLVVSEESEAAILLAIQEKEAEHQKAAEFAAKQEEDRKVAYEERRIRDEQEQVARAARIAKQDALREEVRLWCAEHGKDGLKRAALEGYPFMNRAFEQLYAALQADLLSRGMCVIHYDDWCDYVDHSAPREEEFLEMDRLVQVVEEVRKGVPRFAELELYEKIQRIDLGDRKVAGAAMCLTLGDTSRVLTIRFD